MHCTALQSPDQGQDIEKGRPGMPTTLPTCYSKLGIRCTSTIDEPREFIYIPDWGSGGWLLVRV